MKEKEIEYIKKNLRRKTPHLDKIILFYPYIVFASLMLLLIANNQNWSDFNIGLLEIVIPILSIAFFYVFLVKKRIENRFIEIYSDNCENKTILEVISSLGWKVKKNKEGIIIAYTKMNAIDFGSTITILLIDTKKLLFNSKAIGNTISLINRNKNNSENFKKCLSDKKHSS